MCLFDKMHRSNIKLAYNILNNVHRDIDAICAHSNTGDAFTRIAPLKSDRIYVDRLLSADIDKAVNIRRETMRNHNSDVTYIVRFLHI